MRHTVRFAIVVLPVCWFLHTGARADENRERGEERRTPTEQRRMPVRPAPPRFVSHPPGVHPQGPTVRSHPVRVLAPKVVPRRGGPWAHWSHPDFARPVYYWNWRIIRSVTCTAEDSYGDQYPVTEAARRGFGLDNMTKVEDDALDRCYGESGQDDSCYLLTCTHS